MDIKYLSTNKNSPEVSFKDALFKGLAPDGGLYMPNMIPELSGRELRSIYGKKYWEIAALIFNKFIGDDIPEEQINFLCEDAYNYPVPLEKITGTKHVLRLDRGPTASFKDFAARMMARLMSYYQSEKNNELVILTATSGDTGSAIASAFYGLQGIRVIVLFPRDEVTILQRKQMTTLGQNVQVIAVDGKFDDCQAMVKQAFMDKDLQSMNLTSANSINIGRLIPQTVYYFHAYSKLKSNDGNGMLFSVPSGNFGDLMGGLIAKQMGLPVKKFICATNANDEFPQFLKTGIYEKIEPSRNCISSAMNVGHPSNLARLVSLYGGQMDERGYIHKMPDLKGVRNDIHAVSISDNTTRMNILSAYEDYNLLLEPHGAVGWAGLNDYVETTGDAETLSVVLETAHPAKFPEEIVNILNFAPDIPNTLSGLEKKSEIYISIENSYERFKEFLKEL